MTNNCTHFACDIWNAIVYQSFRVAIDQPQYVIDDILAKDNHYTNYSFPSKPSSLVAYHTLTGVVYDDSEVS